MATNSYVEDIKVFVFSKQLQVLEMYKGLLSFFGFTGIGFDSVDKLVTEAIVLKPKLIVVETGYDCADSLELLELIKEKKIYELTEKGMLVLSYFDFPNSNVENLGEKNVIILKKPVMSDEIIQRFEDLFTA